MAIDNRSLAGRYGAAGLSDSDRIVATGGWHTPGSSSTGVSSNSVTYSTGGTDINTFQLGPKLVVTYQGEPAWLGRTLEQLNRMIQLSPNWDSYGSRAVELQKAWIALDALSEILEAHSPAPAVVPTSDGGLQLEWHRNGIDLEIEPFSPNRISFYARTSDGDEHEGEWTYDVSELCSLVRQLT